MRVLFVILAVGLTIIATTSCKNTVSVQESFTQIQKLAPQLKPISEIQNNEQLIAAYLEAEVSVKKAQVPAIKIQKAVAEPQNTQAPVVYTSDNFETE